jgi:hypothetical protein
VTSSVQSLSVSNSVHGSQLLLGATPGRSEAGVSKLSTQRVAEGLLVFRMKGSLKLRPLDGFREVVKADPSDLETTRIPGDEHVERGNKYIVLICFPFACHLKLSHVT